MSLERDVYFFGVGETEGTGNLKDTLGGKGANLSEMARIGLPVPPGFTITTQTCFQYQETGALPEDLIPQLKRSMARLEKTTGKTFGGGVNPLLVSVRSGAPVSMPGMMDTVLNLGINDEALVALERLSGSARFVRDTKRRFIQMYGNVVSGLPGKVFEKALEALKVSANVEHDTDLEAHHLDALISEYMYIYKEHTGRPFPVDPWEQLLEATSAVFASWNNTRAKTYRRLNRISDSLGTAVNIQAMAYGNLGTDCGTGVGFTRDPSTGEKTFYGEYLRNAQGEDVVAGIRTPLPIHASNARKLGFEGKSLEERFPAAFKELMNVSSILENHYRDVQDIEFTIENGHLHLLQTRTAKRSGQAWLKTQTDLVDEGKITREEAVARIPADVLGHLLAPTLNPAHASEAQVSGRLLTKGLNAGPGAAQGRIVFTANEAERQSQNGQPVILVREETTPEDIHGMHAAEGILTARGGMTSHAAVVARGMGKPCVVGCSELHCDPSTGTLTIGDKTFTADDYITIDGSTGEVFEGTIPIIPSEILQVHVEKSLDVDCAPTCQRFDRVLRWADEVRVLDVRTNADTPNDASIAFELGAQGIGLCRTEHMFFESDRIRAVRQMILAENLAERETALALIEPMQAEDFRGIFRAMKGLPVTIRTLDPPLHEFLPHSLPEIKALADATGKSVEAVQAKVESLRELNPMLGNRGCRLGIQFPEITRMQARAIIRAALDVSAEGVQVYPEIMIPLVGHVDELALQKKVVVEEAETLFAEMGRRIEYLVGTMIEIPRAALTADKIAAQAEFFSFGTNDLTQMTLGVSRDDSGGFLPDYVQRGIYSTDPFVSVDESGVGELMKIAVKKGKAGRAALKLGICGEHGGDPDTIHFCADIGLDYVSCSPYRVPIARFAAAQAALIRRSS